MQQFPEPVETAQWTVHGGDEASPVPTFRRPATNPGPTSLLKGFQEVEGVFTNALVVGALHPLSECARTMVGETRTWCDYSPGRLPSS